MDEPAHEDAQYRDPQGQQQIPAAVVWGEGIEHGQVHRLRVDPQNSGDITGGHRGDKAGKQGRGEEGAHRLKLHAEHHCRQGCAEQPCKYGAHAGHDQDLPLIPADVKDPGDQGGQGAAQLQSCPLPSGAAAEEVGQTGGQKDGGGHCGAYIVAVQRGIDDLVGARIVRQVQPLIQANGEKTAYRQQKQYPWVRGAKPGKTGQGVVKDHTQPAPQDPHQNSQQPPFYKGKNVIADIIQLFRNTHRNLLSFGRENAEMERFSAAQRDFQRFLNSNTLQGDSQYADVLKNGQLPAIQLCGWKKIRI